MQKLIIIMAAFCLVAANSFLFGNDKEKPDSLKVFKTPSITVSTGRAEERRSPVPFSQITAAEIVQRHTVKDLPQLLAEMPSIIVFSEGGNGIGYSNLSMRGFNQRHISVLVNGIPQNDPEDHNMYWINLPDIASSLDNIQVQRGAGVSSNGFPAIGGSINLETSNFTNERGAILETGIGFQELSSQNSLNQSMNKFSLQVSSGLVDNKYAVYGKLSSIRSEGYRDMSWVKMNSYFLSVARFDDNFTTQINVFGGPVEDGLAYMGLPKSYIKDKSLRRTNYNYWDYDSTGKEVNWTTIRRRNELENFSQPHYELLNDWYFNDKIIFKSSLFYYSGEGFFDFDGTGWTDKNTFGLTPENGFPAAEDPRNPIIRAYVLNKHGGWIPRVQLKHQSGTLTLGSEFRIHRSEHWGEIGYAEILPENYNPDYKFYYYEGERDIISLFALEEYNATEKLTLTGELQAVYHSYRINSERLGKGFTQYLNTDNEIVGNGDNLFNIRYLFVNPRIGANYNLDETSNLYTFLAYTSREPRMVNLYDASSSYTGKLPLFEGFINSDGKYQYDFSKPIVKPESMLNIELGYNFRNSDYFLNANAYFMEYFDELVKSGKLDIFGNPIDGNAPRTRHFGVEIQAAAVILNSLYGKLELAGNATLSRNYIVKYDFQTNQGTAVSLADNKIAGFPDAMLNLRLNYSVENLFASISAKYVGDFKTDNFGSMLKNNPEIIQHLQGDYYDDNTLDAFTVFNLDLSYKFINLFDANSIEFRASVYNLFNNLYAAGAEGKEFFPAAERNFYFGIRVGI